MEAHSKQKRNSPTLLPVPKVVIDAYLTFLLPCRFAGGERRGSGRSPQALGFLQGYKTPKRFQDPQGKWRGIRFWFSEDVDLGLLYQILEGHQVWVVEQGDPSIEIFVLMDERGAWTNNIQWRKNTLYIVAHKKLTVMSHFVPGGTNARASGTTAT